MAPGALPSSMAMDDIKAKAARTSWIPTIELSCDTTDSSLKGVQRRKSEMPWARGAIYGQRDCMAVALSRQRRLLIGFDRSEVTCPARMIVGILTRIGREIHNALLFVFHFQLLFFVCQRRTENQRCVTGSNRCRSKRAENCHTKFIEAGRNRS